MFPTQPSRMISSSPFREPTMQPNTPPYRSEAFAEDLLDQAHALPTLRHGVGLRLAAGGMRRPLRQGPYRRDAEARPAQPSGQSGPLNPG